MKKTSSVILFGNLSDSFALALLVSLFWCPSERLQTSLVRARKRRIIRLKLSQLSLVRRDLRIRFHVFTFDSFADLTRRFPAEICQRKFDFWENLSNKQNANWSSCPSFGHRTPQNSIVTSRRNQTRREITGFWCVQRPGTRVSEGKNCQRSRTKSKQLFHTKWPNNQTLLPEFAIFRLTELKWRQISHQQNWPIQTGRRRRGGAEHYPLSIHWILDSAPF